MESIKKIVKNQYFPAAAVLTAVVLFWIIAMFGGLSLLHNNQPPMATLTWMLFVYGAAVLTPLAGILAAMDLIRRWKLNRDAAPAFEEGAVWSPGQDARTTADADDAMTAEVDATTAEPTTVEPESAATTAEGQLRTEPVQTQDRQVKSQPLKKSAQAKQRKKAA